MKANAELTFKAELTELTQEEAELIRDAVGAVTLMHQEHRDDFGISKEQKLLAEEMHRQLRSKFSESNWRE